MTSHVYISHVYVSQDRWARLIIPTIPTKAVAVAVAKSLRTGNKEAEMYIIPKAVFCETY